MHGHNDSDICSFSNSKALYTIMSNNHSCFQIGIPRVSQNEPRPNPNQFLHCQQPLPAVRSHNHNQNSNAIPIIQNSDQTRLILVGFSVPILLDAVVSSHRLESGVGFIFGDNLPTPCYLYVAATNKIFLLQNERIRDSGTTDFPIVVFCQEWMVELEPTALIRMTKLVCMSMFQEGV